jgi:thiol-disulfide isomerase/thioredoxin
MRVSSNFITKALCLNWILHKALSEPNLKTFLYLQEKPEDVYPIQEFSGDGKPDFLYREGYPDARIVEFYAHWCSHCQHFKPHFIEFAKHLQETMDQLSGVDIKVEVHAVSCVPNKAICNDFKIQGFPTVKLFPPNSLNGTTMGLGKLKPNQVLKLLGIETETYSAQKTYSETRGTFDGKNHHFVPRSVKETYNDAHLSLDFVLRNGIFMSAGELDTKAAGALTNFLQVCSRALPSSSSMYPVIEELLNQSRRIVRSEADLTQALDSTGAKPPSDKWSPSCLRHGTGYTCGLWTLFHILTVGTVEWNMGAANPEQRMSTMEVGDAIRNFIEHFFQCNECRAHFLKEYDSCGHDRCNRLISDRLESRLQDWKDLVLWFYETHNGVNVRLRGERIANNEVEDTTDDWQVQWPAVDECPSCWLSRGRWDEDQVYRLLRLQYWPDDYRSAELKKHLVPGEDMHPDVILAINQSPRQSRVDDVNLQVPNSPGPLMGTVLLFVVGGYILHRKRQFNLKGIHKKSESSKYC